MRTSQLILGFVLLAVGFLYYSFTWSDRFLAPVRVGMSQGEVQAVIGSPRREHTNHGAVTWDYTRSWSRDARVYFSTNNVVWAVEAD